MKTTSKLQKKIKLLTSCALLGFSFCAHSAQVTKDKKEFLQGAIADTITTSIVLSGGAIETNPAGFAGATLIKGALYFASDYLSKPNQKILLRIGGAFYKGASVNNTLVFFGISSAATLGIGALVGYLVYTNDGKDVIIKIRQLKDYSENPN